MKNGEDLRVNFDPTFGGEMREKRPVMIVSNDASNKFLREYWRFDSTTHEE